MGENRTCKTVSTVSLSATMEIGRVQIILRLDWNRRFNRADDADGGDAKIADSSPGTAARGPTSGRIERIVAACPSVAHVPRFF